MITFSKLTPLSTKPNRNATPLDLTVSDRQAYLVSAMLVLQALRVVQERRPLVYEAIVVSGRGPKTLQCLRLDPLAWWADAPRAARRCISTLPSTSP